MSTFPPELSKLGFVYVRDFQAAWNLGPRLKVDDSFGPRTADALEITLQRHHAGQPDLSAHFSAREAACHCGGTLPGCHGVRALRALLSGLEAMRRTLDGPLELFDIYRCPKHNGAVGGASSSMHILGAAADPKQRPSLANVQALHCFSGIGHQGAAPHRVTHVDVRHVAGIAGGQDRTGGTLARPTVFTDEG